MTMRQIEIDDADIDTLQDEIDILINEYLSLRHTDTFLSKDHYKSKIDFLNRIRVILSK